MESINVDLLHSKLYDLLERFHLFCVANNLKYYAIGGTALGMKRHEGFIPWDDDVDIGMPRLDYEKLISMIEKLPNGLEIKYFGNTHNYPHHALKLIDSKTTLIENNYRNLVGGLYLDIFPLDGVIDSHRDKKRRKKIYSIKRKIMWHCSSAKETNLIRRMFSWYCKRLNLEKMHTKLEKLVKLVKYEESDFVANLLGAYNEKEIVDKSFFGVPCLYKFEKGFLYGPSNLDSFLRAIYGNYMELPPAESRVLHHSFYYLDLDKPYSEHFIEK